jgi:hypothetical protein
MPEIQAGPIRLFYLFDLFDVAETVDLQAIPALIGAPCHHGPPRTQAGDAVISVRAVREAAAVLRGRRFRDS